MNCNDFYTESITLFATINQKKDTLEARAEIYDFVPSHTHNLTCSIDYIATYSAQEDPLIINVSQSVLYDTGTVGFGDTTVRAYVGVIKLP